MSKFVVDTVTDLRPRVGEELFVTDWLEITQARIDGFAEATGDRQWIHVDVDRARRESPYGSTIAHGFLTLSLVAGFFLEGLDIRKRSRGVNYGLNRVRFMAPVPVGSRVRGRHTLIQYDDIDGGAQLTWKVSVEIEGGDKPACVLEALNRIYA